MADIPDAAVEAAQLEWVGDHLWFDDRCMGYVADLGDYWIARMVTGPNGRYPDERSARDALEKIAREALGI